MNDRKLAGKSR